MADPISTGDQFSPSGNTVIAGDGGSAGGPPPTIPPVTETSALREWGSTSTWHPLFEYVPELIGIQNQIRTYETMRRNDAQVRASLRAVKTPILSATWRVDPGSESKLDQEVAEFVEYNLFQYMCTPWSETLDEALLHLDYGSYAFEQVYKLDTWAPDGKNRRQRPFTMLYKMAPRPPWTTYRYLYDMTGSPDGIQHIKTDPYTGAQTWPPIVIPKEKLLILTNDKQAGNLWGTSILRSAYKHWYFKDHLYTIDSIQKERHGLGIPDITLPPGYTDTDKALAQELAANMRANERAFILKPPGGWEIGFAQIHGHLVDALASAEHHDIMIARNVLAQFINGGTGGAGGRAAATVMLDLFYKSLRHTANRVADAFNDQVIKQLVDYNYAVTNYPKLTARKVGDNKDFQMAAAALANLALAGVITPNADLEDGVLDDFDLPPRDQSKPANPVPNQPQGGSKETTGNVGKGTNI